MVDSLLSFEGINLLHTDSRKLHAGFYAVENKSKEDSEGILRLLLAKQPSMVERFLGRSTGRPATRPSSSRPSARGSSSWSSCYWRRGPTPTGRSPTPATPASTTPSSSSNSK